MEVLVNNGLSGITKTGQVLADLEGNPYQAGNGSCGVPIPGITADDVGKVVVLDPSVGLQFTIGSLSSSTGTLSSITFTIGDGSSNIADPGASFNYATEDGAISGNIDPATWRGGAVPADATADAALLAGYLAANFPTILTAASVGEEVNVDEIGPITQGVVFSYQDGAISQFVSGSIGFPAFVDKPDNLAIGVIKSVDESAGLATIYNSAVPSLALDPNYGPYPEFEISTMQDLNGAATGAEFDAPPFVTYGADGYPVLLTGDGVDPLWIDSGVARFTANNGDWIPIVGVAVACDGANITFAPTGGLFVFFGR